MGPKGLSDETKNEIVQAYLSGEKITAIAAKYGISPTYPGQLTKKQGLPLRRRQPRRAAA